jgi:hypothetical protein
VILRAVAALETNTFEARRAIYNRVRAVQSNQATNVRIRCAVEALPYENPRMSAVTIATMDGKTFAEALERAIERSQSPPLLNGPVQELPPSELKKPMSRYRRF